MPKKIWLQVNGW